MSRKLSLSAIFLLIILVARMLMLLVVVVMQSSIGGLYLIVSLLFALLYLTAAIGILRQARWGSVIAMLIGSIDLLSAFAVGGPAVIRAGAIDVVLLVLAYRQYKMSNLSVTTMKL